MWLLYTYSRNTKSIQLIRRRGGGGGGQRWKLQFVEFMFSPVTPTAPRPGSSPYYTDEETALSDISGMAETLFRMGMLTTKEPQQVLETFGWKNGGHYCGFPLCR